MRRIYGIGTLILSLIVIPSGGGVQPLNFLTDRIHIPYYELWMGILCFVWFIDRLVKHNFSIPPLLKNYKIFTLGLIWMIGIGIVRGNPVIDIIHDIRELSYFFILALIIPEYIKSKGDIKKLLNFFAVGIVAGLILYYTWYIIMITDPLNILDKIMEKYETAGFRVEYRLVYSFSLFAHLIALILTSSLLSERRLKINHVVLLLITIGVVILSQSRALYILLPFGILLLLIKYKISGTILNKRILRFVFLIGSLVVFLGVMLNAVLPLPFIDALKSRAISLFSLEYLIINISNRMVPFELAMEGVTWKEWLFGKGLGTRIYIPWFEGTDFKPMNRYLDNQWATMIVKGGIIGILATASFFVTFIKMATLSTKSKDKFNYIWLALWAFGILKFIGYRAYFYDAMGMALFGFFSGIMLSKLKLAKTKENDGHDTMS
ncbi:MAG: DUF6369 family protein [Nitrososphaeria archaeon]